MSPQNLTQAIEIISALAKNENAKSLITLLKEELNKTTEHFVWKTLDEYLSNAELSNEFKSAWLFVIRKNTPSKAHYHPNSTQYTAVIEGEGFCEFEGVKKSLEHFNPLDVKTLYVIEKGIPHEFFPGDEDLIVVSLHTCKAEELIDIDFLSGNTRHYQ